MRISSIANPGICHRFHLLLLSPSSFSGRVVRPGDSISEWLATWAAYSADGVCLPCNLVQYFQGKEYLGTFPGRGGFWLDCREGSWSKPPTSQLPLSISFTGLAWHALITVWVGWYAVRKSLHSTNRLATLKIAAAIGLCYGLWAISWWGEPDGGVSTILEFATFSFIATILVIFAYRFSDWSSAETFTPNRWSIMIIGGLALLYFLFVTIPAQPLAALILPVLLGLVYLGLRWNRQSEPEGSLLYPSIQRVFQPGNMPPLWPSRFARWQSMRSQWFWISTGEPTGFFTWSPHLRDSSSSG